MYQLTMSSLLRILASGINPDTGLPMPEASSVHSKTYRRYLERLADEFEDLDNIPEKSHPKKWTDEELKKLADEWGQSSCSLERIAESHQRSELAIALRLIVSGIADQDDVLPHLSSANQRLAEISLSEKKQLETSK